MLYRPVFMRLTVLFLLVHIVWAEEQEPVDLPVEPPEKTADDASASPVFVATTGRFGNRSGAGRRRAIGRYGGSRASESAVEAALRWFAIHQSPNGQWSVTGFPMNCSEEGPKAEPGTVHTGAAGDRAVSAYALLCYLGAGYDHRTMSRWRQMVSRGIDWLIEAHDGEYVYGRNYEQAIVAHALAEAFGLSGDSALREPAQKTIDVLIARQARDAQGRGLGWDYMRPNPSRNDASVSIWVILALRSAYLAGLDTGDALEGAERYLRLAWQAANPNHAVLAVADSSGFPYTWNGTQAGSVRRTNRSSIGLLAGCLLGVDHQDVMMQTMANHVMQENLTESYPCNTYYLHHATLAMFQLGGERWQAWNAAMRDTLVAAQRKDPPCLDGSWDHEGTAFHGHNVGRLVSTAYVTLSLQTYYRYLRTGD